MRTEDGVLYVEQPLTASPAPEAGRQQRYTEEIGAARSCASATSVHQLVAAQAARTPHALAVASEDEQATYGELERRATQLAHTLYTLGVRPGSLVGLFLERSVDFVLGALGVLKAGAAYVPLDPDSPAQRLAYMLRDAQVPVLLTQKRLQRRLPSGSWHVLHLDTDELAIAGTASDPPPSPTPGQHVAYVIYTSGSTGQPKGVQITHDSLLNLVYWHQQAFAVTPADRATQLAGLGFDAAVWELWPYLTIGASIHIADEATRRDAVLLRDWLAAQRITISFAPTALAESLMTLEWPRDTALRILLTGADTLHAYPPETLPFRVFNNYGPTECTVVATSGQVLPRAHPDGPPTIGRPIANTYVYILDEHLQPVVDGEPGEIYIGGAGVGRGYLNNSALTEERFLADPFSGAPGARMYKTGDRGRYLPDGQLAFLGRLDEQIKIRGYRIEPEEIVTILNRCPDVQASVVTTYTDANHDKRLVAYIVPRPGAQLSVRALHDVLRAALPDYMTPLVFVPLDALPLTLNGKVDRAALPHPNEANTLRDEVFIAPRTPLEERVAEILTSLLKVEHIGVNDNFFLLGGNSLLGTQVISRLRDAFGVELSLRAVFNAPTVAGLSSEVERLLLARLETMSEEEARRLLT
jgi:amino acid adenylation domain-containing protein